MFAGLGALVMRKEAANILHKVYFGGGAVDDATAQVEFKPVITDLHATSLMSELSA